MSVCMSFIGSKTFNALFNSLLVSSNYKVNLQKELMMELSFGFQTSHDAFINSYIHLVNVHLPDRLIFVSLDLYERCHPCFTYFFVAPLMLKGD